MSRGVAYVACVGAVCISAALAAAVNKSDTYASRVGIAYLDPDPAPAGAKPGVQLRDAPGEDREPHGFYIYESVHALPEYRVTAAEARHEKCFKDFGRVCLKGHFCGYSCEQILLAVQSFCEHPVEIRTRRPACLESRRNEASCFRTERVVKWKTCEKARKYNKCYPRVCYRRLLVDEKRYDAANGSVPEPHVVETSFAITRYQKPPPRRT